MHRPSFIGTDKFGPLLVLLLGLFVLAPALQRSRGGTVVLGCVLALILVATLLACGVEVHRLRLWSLVGGVGAVVVTVGVLVVDGEPPAWVTGLLAGVLIVTTGLVLRRIIHQDRVTLSTVAGALCAYIMIGLAFGLVYRTISVLDVDAFSQPIGDDASYFSFVTLTTLGYGDITPVSETARSLTVLEAVLGQVLLVVLVARFVGNLGQTRERPGQFREFHDDVEEPPAPPE